MKLILLLISVNLYAQSHTCSDINLKHEYYSLCFSSDKKISRWVEYTLNEEMIDGYAERSNRFNIDPLIPNNSPHPDHYKYSGYDRGHLAPARDMKINQEAMDQSFYMTNIAAQEPSFNRGIWKKLENRVRKFVTPNKKFRVITGPVFKFKKRSYKSRFLNIPRAFFKIIFYEDQFEKKALAFLIPNQKSNAELETFLVSIDKIEAITGIDFFANIPKSIQVQFESTIKQDLWRM